jgi:hypothetical protein
MDGAKNVWVRKMTYWPASNPDIQSHYLDCRAAPCGRIFLCNVTAKECELVVVDVEVSRTPWSVAHKILCQRGVCSTAGEKER